MIGPRSPEQFLEALARLTGGPAPDDEEVAAVLDLARAVAHGVERRLAPVSAYAVGLALGATGAAADPAERRRLLAAATALAADPPVDRAPEEG